MRGAPPMCSSNARHTLKCTFPAVVQRCQSVSRTCRARSAASARRWVENNQKKNNPPRFEGSRIGCSQACHRGRNPLAEIAARGKRELAGKSQRRDGVRSYQIPQDQQVCSDLPGVTTRRWQYASTGCPRMAALARSKEQHFLLGKSLRGGGPM